jgi:acyl-CoA synthetase (NDP forming)
MTDLAEKEGLTVPQLTDDTIAKLGEFIPPQGSSTKNPLDIMPYLQDETNYLRVLTLLDADPAIDALIFDLHPEWILEDFGNEALDLFLASVFGSRKVFRKPMFFVLAAGRDAAQVQVVSDVTRRFHEAGMATFPNFKVAARIIKRLNTYCEHLQIFDCHTMNGYRTRIV